jgi:formylmethanofuran dehydrogenase subunit D
VVIQAKTKWNGKVIEANKILALLNTTTMNITLNEPTDYKQLITSRGIKTA